MSPAGQGEGATKLPTTIPHGLDSSKLLRRNSFFPSSWYHRRAAALGLGPGADYFSSWYHVRTAPHATDGYFNLIRCHEFLKVRGPLMAAITTDQHVRRSCWRSRRLLARYQPPRKLHLQHPSHPLILPQPLIHHLLHPHPSPHPVRPHFSLPHSSRVRKFST